MSKRRCGSRARPKERREGDGSSGGRVETIKPAWGGGARTTAEERASGGRNSQTRGLLGKEEPKLEKGDGERGGGRRRLWDQLSGCPQDSPPAPALAPPPNSQSRAVARALPRPGSVL